MSCTGHALYSHKKLALSFCGLFAAAVHDYEHPGVTGGFLVRTRHPLAVRYNDVAVLENHHVSAAFHLMMTEGGEVFGSLSEREWSGVRKMMILMVLSTDAASHFGDLALFKTKVGAGRTAGGFPANHAEDKQILMGSLLRAADMSNAARGNESYVRWVQRVLNT